MKKQPSTIIRQLLILLLSGLLMSCGGGGESTDNISSTSQYASISISLGTNSTAKASAGSTILPDDITRCTATCTGPGMTEISAELPLDGSTLIMDNIPPGASRVVTINAYNNQLLRMSGSTTIASLTAGTRTSVSIRVEDVSVMLISLDPIADIATAVDSTFVQITPSTTLQLYSGVTNHVDDSVTWHVNGIEGGTAGTGAISTTGLYHAPATTGSFTIQTVSNEDSTLTDSITIAVVNTPANIPPVANAGADRTVLAGASVTLNGTTSSDSDGTVTNFHWAQTLGTTVTLSDADTVTPLFVAPNITSAETLTFELTVTDNDGATNSDTISIIVQPAGTGFHISPKIVHLLPSTTQQFISSHPSNWWEVEGTEGGNSTCGTITTTGSYDAPWSIATNPFDITIEAVAIDNTNNTDTAKVAVVQDTVWQRTFNRSGYELAATNVPISLGRIIGPYPHHSNIVGMTKNASGTNYLFFDEVGDSTEFSSIEPLAFYQLDGTASWDGSNIHALRTSPYGYDDEFLVAGETSLPSGILNEAIGLVRTDRQGQIQWANQYETGPLTVSYPCINSRYPFNGAMENTSGNGFITGFSYYHNDECQVDQNHFLQAIFFYVIDQNGTLTRNIRIDPAHQPGTDRYTAEMYTMGVHSTSDGGYLALVNVNVRPRQYITHIPAAPVIVKLDGSFQLSWVRQFSQDAFFWHFDRGPSNSFYLTSSTSIVQINENGVVLDQQEITSATGMVSLDQVLYDDTEGSLYVSGRWHKNGEDWGGTLIKTDINFSIDWQHAYGSNSQFSSAYVRSGSIFLSGSRTTRDNHKECTVLRIPTNTGQLDSVSENIPTTPDMVITTATTPMTTFDITTGSTYDDNSLNGVEVNAFNPVTVAIPPTIVTHTRSGQLLTIALAQKPDVSRIYNWGDHVQFYATLSHLLTDTSVTWSVNGINGGNSTVGTIDTTGLYTSPDTPPSPATVIIRATSIEEPSLSAERNLTIDDAGGGG